MVSEVSIMNSDELTKADVREIVRAAVHREEWYERFVRLMTDDEYFLKDILEGASEDEIEKYFQEFPEYENYRSMID